MSRVGPHRAAALGLGTAALVGLLLHPLAGTPAGHLPGDPGTDVVRAAWGVAHLWRALPPDGALLWSSAAHFPQGALILPLPAVTALPASLLTPVAGPVAAAWAQVAVALWMLGLGSALLALRTVGRVGPALAVAGVVLGAPAVHGALMDGTPEHLAWGLLPLGLAALLGARHRPLAIGGVGAAALFALLPFDSPYAAVYALPLGAAALALPGPRARAPLAVAAAGALLGVGAFALLQDAVAPPPSGLGTRLTEWSNNAADPLTCLESGPQPRAPQRPPAGLPVPVLAALLALAARGRPASTGPWALAALLMAAASFGLHPSLDTSPALAPVRALNEALLHLPGVGELRFPRRWWGPATLAAALAAAPGLARALPRRGQWAIGATFGVAALLAGVHHSGLWAPFPAAPLHRAESAAWVGAQPGDGAVLTLPHTPPPEAHPGTAPRPFAGLPVSTPGTGAQQLQLQHGRATVDGPALLTAAPMRIDLGLVFALRGLDALALPAREGRPIPPAARSGAGLVPREVALAAMHAQGLRFVMIDRALYAGEGEALLDAAFAPWAAETRDFADGEGVRVIRLRD